MKELVLVHGAWHGAWCWQQTLSALSAQGIDAHTIDLPFEGLQADVAALRGLLDTIDGPKVVLGHSYGGLVISDAAAGRSDVDHLVYLCALMLEVGEDPVALARATSTGAKLFDAVDIDEATGMTVVQDSEAARLFYADCTPADCKRAAEKRRAFPMSSLVGPQAEPWRDIASTYVVCRDDAAISPSLQRDMSRHARTTVEWPTSHSPFLSRTDLMVELLAPLLREA